MNQFEQAEKLHIGMEVIDLVALHDRLEDYKGEIVKKDGSHVLIQYKSGATRPKRCIDVEPATVLDSYLSSDFFVGNTVFNANNSNKWPHNKGVILEVNGLEICVKYESGQTSWEYFLDLRPVSELAK